ncbi:hypothetical protein CJ030_MR4G029047 [Morella rubra]|uniref:C-JID domain-containing protein n=1 Tax=Morella rubra TaxID=262757 RepID=A0A6A1VU46_9ROSI|nr:hypothetical protein CJ030_MR4G029047 [Morella rubra]
MYITGKLFKSSHRVDFRRSRIYTVINCLSLQDNEEDKVTEVSFLDTHFQPSWMEEQIQHSKRYHSIPQTAIPEWFNHRSGSCILIPLPPGLSKNSRWRGIVLYTSFRFRSYPGLDFHELVWHLNMDGGLADCTINFSAPKDQCGAGSFGLCLYISHARFRDHLDGRNCISPSITTSSQLVDILACGGRILYEQDMVEFVQILTQKNFGWSPLVVVEYLHIPLPDELCETDPLDFHPSDWYNYCFPPGKIEEWFTHHSRGHFVAIDLPPYLYDDDTWMGLAFWASFSINRDPETFRTTVDVGTKPCARHYRRREIMWLVNLRKFIWISYIPREQLKYMSGQSHTHIVASLESHWPGMTMEKCALRLLYQHDRVQFEQKLKDCNDLISEYGHPRVQFVVDQENRNKTQPDDAISLRGTVLSSTTHWAKLLAAETNGDLSVTMSVTPIHHQTGTNRIRSESAPLGFDPYALYDECFSTRNILDWFSHRSDEAVAIIPLPPNLYDNRTWMGFALCASFSVFEQSTAILDSQVPYHLVCSLETDLGSLERFHMYRLIEDDRMKLRLGGCLWLSYVPRSSFPNCLNRCSYIEASIATDCAAMTVERCGFRLLFQNDEIEFDEAMDHYWASDKQGGYAWWKQCGGKKRKTNLKDKAKPSTASSRQDEAQPSATSGCQQI